MSVPGTPPGRVVVLGASGFVGSHVAARLRGAGVAVLAPASAELDLRQPGSGSALGRMLRPDDALVMCAALTPDRGRDAATMIANLTMAQHACEALSASGSSHVVYVSSDAVYQDGVNVVDERSCASPSTLYGLMHLAREQVFAAAAESARAPLLVLRPCALYGPGDTHGSYGPNRFARTALADGVIKLFGEGEDRRDHVYVEDLCRVVALGLTRRTEGVLNVATGRSVSFMEVANAVAALASGAVRVVREPRATPLTHRQMDVSALRDAFPDVTITSLHEGLSNTIAALRSRSDMIGRTT